MSQYILLGQQITFSKAEDNFYKLQDFLWRSAKKFEKEYAAWYASQNTILNVLNNVEGFVTHTMDKIVLSPLYPDLAKEYELYGISQRDYLSSCLDISAVEGVRENAIEIYNNIQEQLQDELDERAYNEEWRKAGQVSFGIGDSIKNAASNAAHGIAKSSGDSSSREKAENRKNKLYADVKEPLWDAIKDSIVTTITNYQTFVNEKRPDSIYSYFDASQSDAYLENAKSVEENREELLIEAFKKCPWNYDVYKYIFNMYPQERRNIIAISKNYDVHLITLINNLLRTEYSDEAKANEELAVLAKNKIKNMMADLGVESSVVIDEIEKDCLDRLIADLSIATEERCNELRVQLQGYDALDKNKTAYFDKITKRTEEIWAKEDGEIFDNYLMQADLLSAKAVEEGKQYVKAKGRTQDADKYSTAFAYSNKTNIRRARLYQSINTSKMSMVKYLGWALIAAGIVLLFILGFVSLVPIVVGGIYQFYISIIKNVWTAITVNGKVINPIITISKKEFEAKCRAINNSATPPSAA